MKDLSISQSYLLCVLTEKGKLPILSPETSVCLIGAGIMELVFSRNIIISNGEISIVEELSNDQQHLRSLYYFIKETPNSTLDKVTSEYYFSVSNKKFKNLLEDIGSSLVEVQCVEAQKSGVFGKMTYFIPNTEEVDDIIRTMREELFESEELSEKISALTILLEKSNQIKKFFSPSEKKQLRERIKEINKDTNNQWVKEMMDYMTTMIAIIASVR